MISCSNLGYEIEILNSCSLGINITCYVRCQKYVTGADPGLLKEVVIPDNLSYGDEFRKAIIFLNDFMPQIIIYYDNMIF